jgi:DNA-binding CsgD family transcriptional regulator
MFVVDVNWPLVGRFDEVEVIHSVPAAGGVLLFGDAGVGKTRLLREAIRAARGAGHAVELVAATRAAASVPLSAVSHLLPVEQPGGQRENLFRQVAMMLLRRCQGSRVVLAVDDAHLLDNGSAALVHYLSVHRHVTVMATARTGEPAPDAVLALWKDGLARRHEVPPLADDAVDQLLEHALGGPVADTARAALRTLAAGNPLYLRELLADGVSLGALWRGADVWQWRGSLRGARRLTELVDDRLRAVERAGRAVIELVACAEPVAIDLLRDEPGLSLAERAGLLDSEDAGNGHACGGGIRVRLAHPIYGEVLRANLSPLRLREIHRDLACRLGRARPLGQDDLLRLVTWQLAGGLRPATPSLLPAARHAMARHDLPLAERLARAAVTAKVAGARPVLAEVLHWLGRHDESFAVVATDPTDPAERGRWFVARTRSLYFGLSRHDEATAEVTRADPVARVDDPGVGSVRAMILLSEGRCVPAQEIAMAVLGDENAPIDTRLWSATAAVNAGNMLGHNDRALALAEYGFELALRPSAVPLIAVPHLRMAWTNSLLTAGRLRAARVAAEEGYRAAIAVDDRALVSAWATLRGSVAQVQGELDTAVASLREAVAVDEAQDPIGHTRHHLTMLAGVLAMSGASVEARSVLERADAIEAALPRLFAPLAEKNRAWVAMASGELTRAVEIALRGAELARAADLPYLEATLLYDAVRHGHGPGPHERLIELACVIDGELAVAYATAATARAHSDSAGLEAAAANFQALGAPLPALECLLAARDLHRSAGHSRRAGAIEEQARLLAERHRLPSVPVADPTHALTRREREIALLAVRPASSKEVAEQLGLSVRTVDNHLTRVYAKLGVSGRAELARLISLPDSEISRE